MVDMGKPVTFSKLYLMEKNNRIFEFKVEYLDGADWKELYSGKRLNFFSLKTVPVTTQRVRLRVLKTRGGPAQLHIFDLF
jgi:hypothetical protein